MTSKWSAWRATATARPTRSEHSTAASGLARNPKPPPAQPTCGEGGRGAVMSTCMHETQSRRPHSPPQTALARRRAPRTRARRRSWGRADRCVHSAAAKGTESLCQCQSMSINANRWQSMAINDNQCQSMAINDNQCQSMAINFNRWHSMAITCSHWNVKLVSKPARRGRGALYLWGEGLGRRDEHIEAHAKGEGRAVPSGPDRASAARQP